MSPKESVILFDLDGTLIDSTEAILESFEAAYARFGQRRPETERITAEIGHPLDGMFLSLGIPPERVAEYVSAYKRHYRQISREKTTLLPDAGRAVERAAVEARLGIVTTKTAEYSIELLEHMGLMGYFDVLIGREDVIHPKPHPEPIHKALSILDAKGDSCWMIGDTCMDMHSARSAGIVGIGVTCGYAAPEQLAACSSHVRKSALDAVVFIAES